MFWDNRVRSLETQARGPLHAEREMRGSSLADESVAPELARRLSALPEYVARFEAAFGSREITEDRIVMAIAAFERTLTGGTSPFDRFMHGDDAALSTAQRRGLVGFFAAGCGACHGGPMFSDFGLHAIGAGTAHPGLGDDHGDGQDRFRTPSLRNVARTAPYMHDGSLATLDDVYDFYLVVDASRDPALGGLSAVVGTARSDMKRFLEALSDDAVDDAVPERLPSGLPVGGLRHRR
jgi:cytochrome c peroxidase